MIHTFSTVDQIQLSINARWGIIDWKEQFPWWRLPTEVRILMYADSVVRFKGGSFLGLQYVYNLLKSRAYSYVDFQIDTAHRDGDPSASIAGAKKLTDLDIIANYDQIWFFGFNNTPNLSPDEVTLLDKFMAAPKFGGVLVTGDHADLGKGIAGQITRAGQMRRYPAPPDRPPVWNTTLEDGPDARSTYDFNDQSDDRPQDIRYKRYPIGVKPLAYTVERRYRPHPVLCGPDGPITVFPDHQHEGEALAPRPTSGDPRWPTKNGYQESPEVIAWGRIKDPDATKYGQEIGLVSTYNGHNVDVGRIIADSTWHHWFDINLTGLFASPSPYAGFDETAAGRAALKQIDAYFLNCGVWLAPPDKQTQMGATGWWSILWSNQIVELSLDTPIWRLGEEAIDVLGQIATRCTVAEWIFDFPIFKEKIPRWEWPQLFEQFQLIDLPFEQFVAGGILNQLRQEVGSLNPKLSFPEKAPEDEILRRAMLAGVEEGLSTLTQQFQREADLILKLAANDFRLEALKEQ